MLGSPCCRRQVWNVEVERPRVRAASRSPGLESWTWRLRRCSWGERREAVGSLNRGRPSRLRQRQNVVGRSPSFPAASWSDALSRYAFRRRRPSSGFRLVMLRRATRMEAPPYANRWGNRGWRVSGPRMAFFPKLLAVGTPPRGGANRLQGPLAFCLKQFCLLLMNWEGRSREGCSGLCPRWGWIRAWMGLRFNRPTLTVGLGASSPVSPPPSCWRAQSRRTFGGRGRIILQVARSKCT